MNNLRSQFEFVTLSSSPKERFADGRLISTHEKCGFFLCLRGEIKIGFGGSIYTLKSGDAYAYMPSTTFRPISRTDDADGIMVLIDVDYILHITLKVVGVENLMFIKEHPYVPLSNSQFQTMFDGIVRLRTLVEDTKWEEVDPSLRTLYVELQKSIVETIFYELLCVILKNHKPTQVIRSKHDEVFLKFLVSLFKNYKTEREVNFYANEQCISPRYFTTIIREKSGRSAIQWISNLVVNDIKQMLETSNASIKEISESFGFQTQSFFGKYFKQYVGMSPRAYRKHVFAELK
jgi:AraC-like DNA-binding protein